MREQAIVVKTTGKIAVLRIQKRPECEGCKICAFKEGQSVVKVKAKNTVGAKAGDTVIVQAEKDNRLLASFIVYILPVLFAAAGAAVAFLLWTISSGRLSAVWRGLSWICGCVSVGQMGGPFARFRNGDRADLPERGIKSKSGRSGGKNKWLRNMIPRLSTPQWKRMRRSSSTFLRIGAGPCRMLAPVMETLSEEFGDKARFVKINVDDNPELARRFSIMSIPCVMVFKKRRSCRQKRRVYSQGGYAGIYRKQSVKAAVAGIKG